MCGSHYKKVMNGQSISKVIFLPKVKGQGQIIVSTLEDPVGPFVCYRSNWQTM